MDLLNKTYYLTEVKNFPIQVVYEMLSLTKENFLTLEKFYWDLGELQDTYHSLFLGKTLDIKRLKYWVRQDLALTAPNPSPDKYILGFRRNKKYQNLITRYRHLLEEIFFNDYDDLLSKEEAGLSLEKIVKIYQLVRSDYANKNEIYAKLKALEQISPSFTYYCDNFTIDKPDNSLDGTEEMIVIYDPHYIKQPDTVDFRDIENFITDGKIEWNKPINLEFVLLEFNLNNVCIANIKDAKYLIRYANQYPRSIGNENTKVEVFLNSFEFDEQKMLHSFQDAMAGNNPYADLIKEETKKSTEMLYIYSNIYSLKESCRDLKQSLTRLENYLKRVSANTDKDQIKQVQDKLNSAKELLETLKQLNLNMDPSLSKGTIKEGTGHLAKRKTPPKTEN